MKPLLLLTALLLCGCEPDKVAEWTANSEPNLESRESYRIMWNGEHYKIQRKAIAWERRAYGKGGVFGRSLYEGTWTDEYAMRKPTFATTDEASAEIDWLIRKRLTDMGKARADELKQATEKWVNVTPLAKGDVWRVPATNDAERFYIRRTIEPWAVYYENGPTGACYMVFTSTNGNELRIDMPRTNYLWFLDNPIRFTD